MHCDDQLGYKSERFSSTYSTTVKQLGLSNTVYHEVSLLGKNKNDMGQKNTKTLKDKWLLRSQVLLV